MIWVFGGGFILWYGLSHAYTPLGHNDTYGIGTAIVALTFEVTTAAFLASAIPRTIWIWLKAKGQSRAVLWALHFGGVIVMTAVLAFWLGAFG